MGDRNKEFVSFVVDVGPGMHNLLPYVEEYLLCSIEAKISNKAHDEVAVLLFGTTETNNEPHEEAKANGDDTQYTNISVLHNYTLPSISTLRSCKALPRGNGEMSDVTNAITVANDMLVKCVNDRALSDKIKRRFVLVSNFANKNLGWDEEFTQQMAKSLQDHKVQLEVIHLDFLPPPNSQENGGMQVDEPASLTAGQQALVDENLNGLTTLMSELGASDGIKRIQRPADLSSAPRWIEVMPTTTYRGSLSIGRNTRIMVKVYKKVSRQGVPSMKSYVPAALGAPAEGLEHTAARAREFRVDGQPDQRVEEADTVKGYKYGRQYVPVDATVEDMMKYSVPDKEISMWGFLPASQVKRFGMMGESLVIVPDPDTTGAGEAVSALVRAMDKEKQVAVARYVARANSRPTLLLLTPWLGTMRRPDCWIGNTLPFEQDFKWVDFPALGGGTPIPQQQVDAATALVDAMQLTASKGSGQELLAPEQTANPVLRRFYLTAVNKAFLDAEGEDQAAAQVPSADADTLVQAVFSTPAAVLTASQDARARMAQLFPTHVVARTQAAADGDVAMQHVFGGEGEAGGEGGLVVPTVGGAPANTVGTATPLDDFAVLLAQPGKAKDAVMAMRGVILQLVDESVGSRNYDKAAACVSALRTACIEHQLPAEFNEHLEGLATRYEHHEAHAPFFARLVAAQVGPISQDEAPGAEGAVSGEERAAWLRTHTPSSTGAAAPAPAAAAEDDEFADME